MAAFVQRDGPFINSGTGIRTPNSCSRGRRVAGYTIPDRKPKNSGQPLAAESYTAEPYACAELPFGAK